MKLIWAVSGRGMAARAVAEAQFAGLLTSKLDMVFFDKAATTESMAAYCSRNQIPCKVIAPGRIEDELLELQQSRRFDCMGLTFDRLISESVIRAFDGQIFNLHLSLLPQFPGFGAVRKALAAGIPYTGVTVHYIDAGIDTGPIIAQAQVSIDASDTEASLGRRQFEAAVPLILQTVRLLERGEHARFDLPDADLRQFAVDYCRQI